MVRAFDQDAVVIGRGPDNDVVLDDASVSKRHAAIERKQGGFWLKDEGSTNGVYVDGVRASGPVQIAPGLRLGIGDFFVTIAVTDDVPKDSFRIAVTQPDGQTHVFTLEGKDATLGTAADADLQLDGAGVSPRHLRVVIQSGRIVLADLKSTAGTWVNGERLTGPRVVREGDVARAGCFTLSFAQPGEAGPLPAPPIPSVEEDRTVPTADAEDDRTPARSGSAPGDPDEGSSSDGPSSEGSAEP